MKNTLILDMDNNASCECIQQLADNTNRVFVEMYSVFYEAPTFNLIAGSVNTQLNYTKENNVYKLALPDTISQYDAFKLSISDKSLSQNTEINFKCNNLKSSGNMLLKKENGYYLLTAKITESIATVNDVKKMISDALLEKSKQEKPIGHIEFNTTGKNPNTYLGFGTWVAWGSGRVPVGVSASDANFNTTEKTGGAKTHILTVAQMPVHNHTFTGTKLNTDGNNVSHTHGIPVLSGWTLGAGLHSHAIKYKKIGTAGTTRNAVSSATDCSSTPNLCVEAGQHRHEFKTNAATTGAQGTNHIHAFTAAGTISNTGGGQEHNNLQPYITCYMWKRTA